MFCRLLKPVSLGRATQVNYQASSWKSYAFGALSIWAFGHHAGNLIGTDSVEDLRESRELSRSTGSLCLLVHSPESSCLCYIISGIDMCALQGRSLTLM